MAGEVVINRPPEILTGGETRSSPSHVNGQRISFFVDRLLSLIRGDLQINNEFCSLCISLARNIDYAVANNEIADRASDLPNLLKQVCQWKNGAPVLAAAMVLMISIKGASKNGWFDEKDSNELHNLWNEIASSFCSIGDMNTEESTFHHSISAVMSRFYPGMKMGEILAFVEAMPGYGAILKDFHIPKNAKDDAIYLFVAQTDNTETSSCIVSPQQVNFLVNGRAVDKRTCLYKDPGPQIPTFVKHMVKHGTNLLQVVGHFSGKYIIVIAFMSIVSTPSCPTLPDYVRPVAAASDTDNDVIEGLSRVSLNCPISFKRIKTPVKGHLCNHLQCFDFDNYVDINSRRPSWRCPHCSQSVCFTDIRIDQGMVKVLKEVGVDVSHVKISAEGSWETVNEGGDYTHKLQDKPPSHQESNISLDVGGDILDLTGTDNDMDSSNCPQEIDRKPSVTHLQDVNMNNVRSSIASHIETQSWRTELPSPANGACNSISNVTMGAPANAISHDLSQLYAPNNTQLPTYAIGSSNTRSNVTVMAPIRHTVMNAILQSRSQSQTFTSDGMHSQQHNSNNLSNGYLRSLTPGMEGTRISTPVQAPPVIVGGDTQQQYSGPQMDQRQIRHIMSAALSQNMSSQNWVHSGVPIHQLIQQFGAPTALPQDPNGSLQTSPHPANQFYSQQHHPSDPMLAHSLWSTTQLSPQVHQGVEGFTTGLGSYQQALHYTMATAQRAIQTSGAPPVPTPLHTSGSSMPQIFREAHRGQAQQVNNFLANAPVDMHMRPAGIMRGSLSGQAYFDAVNQMIVHPAQPVQAARPRALNTPRPVLPPHLQVLLRNNSNVHDYRNQHGASGWC
uniref:E4 SUMO-protein ligase PIAL2-like n=1 Tax=Erigeron canadensis TaxID=72917 RepID=UPI001CB9A5D0|nr:E4 SUMO-protein ligase PIAL2-like [Erigeron canadensis]